MLNLGNSKIVSFAEARRQEMSKAVAQITVSDMDIIYLAMQVIEARLEAITLKYKLARIDYKDNKELVEVIALHDEMDKALFALKKTIEP